MPTRATIGANPHLAAELFKSMAGVNIVQVAYKGTGPGVIGLMGGEVELMFPNAGSATPYIKSDIAKITKLIKEARIKQN